MSERFRGFLLTGGLIVVTWLQGCASSSPVAKSASTEAGNAGAVVAAPAVNQPEPSPAPIASPSAELPPPISVVETPPSTVGVSATHVRVEPTPPLNAQVGASHPSTAVKAKAQRATKPVSREKPKPVNKAEPRGIEKGESAGTADQTEKPAAGTKPAVPTIKPVVSATKPVDPTTNHSDQTTKPATPTTKPPASTPDVQPTAADEEGVSGEPLPAPEIGELDIEVTLDSLPITIRDQWVLSSAGDTCSLTTLPIRFDDGQGMSKLQLVLTTQHWLIKTQSDIDLSYTGTGLMVDDGQHFPLDQLVRQSDLMFTKEYAAITQAFTTGNSLRITLGFWPTWPITETKMITVPLQHFATAQRAWKQCLSLISGH